MNWTLLKFFIFSNCLSCALAAKKGQKSAPPPTETSFLNELKPLLMHFAEPFLNQASIKNFPLDALSPPEFVPHVCYALKSFKTKNDVFLSFAADLKKAEELWSSTQSIVLDSVYPASPAVNEAISKLSDQLFPKNDKIGSKKIVFFDWKHPGGPNQWTIFVVKRTADDAVNLAFINTGTGAQYHSKVDDPNTDAMIVPWLEFKNVRIADLTSHGNWFAHGILAMKNQAYTDELVKRDNDLAYYIYGSFLGNLGEFLSKPVSVGKKKFLSQKENFGNAYSVIMATMLYYANSQQEFEIMRAQLGLKLFENFWGAFKDNADFKATVEDAKEMQARALLKTLSAGMARQANEVWEASSESASTSASASNLNPAQKKIPITDALPAKTEKLIKTLVGKALGVASFFKTIKVNPETAKLTFPETLDSLLKAHPPIDAWKDYEDLTRGSADLVQGMTFNLNEAKEIIPPATAFPVIKSLVELQKALVQVYKDTGVKNTFGSRDETRMKLNEMLLHKVLPIFKAIGGSKLTWLTWIDKETDKKILVDTMDANHEIVKNVMKNTKGRMFLEELLALEQLMLLTWKCAQKYDSLVGDVFKLNSYSAPINSESLYYYGNYANLANGKASHNMEHQTYLDPKLQFTSVLGSIEAESWAWLKKTDDALVEPGKLHFFAPSDLFDTPFGGYDFLTLRDNIPKHLLEALKTLKKGYSASDFERNSLKAQIFFFQRKTKNFNEFYSLMEPLLKVGSPISWHNNRHPQFFMAIEMGYMIGKMQFIRPTNELELSDSKIIWTSSSGLIFNQDRRGSGKYYPPTIYEIRQSSPDKHIFSVFNDHRESKYRNDRLGYYGIYRSADLRSKYSSGLELFNGSRMSCARINALLSWIEGNRSGAPFRIPSVYHAIDRMLANHYVLRDAQPHTHKRLLKALKAIIDNDMKKFGEIINTSSLSERQNLLHKSLQAAFVLVRYMHYLKVHEVHLTELESTLSEFYLEIYRLYWPFLKLKSKLIKLEDADIASVQGLLYLLLSVRPSDPEGFLKDLTLKLEDESELQLNTDVPEDAISALSNLHAFIYIHYRDQVPERLRFTDVYDFAQYNQQTEICESHQEFLAKALKYALLPVFDQDNGKEFTALWPDSDLIRLQAPLKDSELSEEQQAMRKKQKKAERVPLHTTYWARLSTGEFYRDKTRIITQQVFLKNPKFRAFIGEEYLTDALKGEVKSMAYQSVYSLTHFRDLDAHFVFTIGADKKLRAFRLYEEKRWAWIEDDDDFGQNIAKKLGIFSLEGRKLFYRQKKDRIVDFILIRNDEVSHFAKFTITLSNSKSIESISISFSKVLDASGKPITWSLLNDKIPIDSKDKSATVGMHHTFATILPESVVQFAGGKFATFIQEPGFGPSLLFGPFRHTASQENPFILRNTCKKAPYKSSCFTLQHRPEWSLDENQLATETSILKGTLIMKHSLDASRQLFFPRLQHPASRVPPLQKSDENNESDLQRFQEELQAFNYPPPPCPFTTESIAVDTAIIYKNDIVPKSREQRLALAYKFTQELMIDSARAMLHPAKSLDHNSEFSEAEKKIVKDIIFFANSHLEVAAIRMMALMHLILDQAIFSKYPSRDILSSQFGSAEQQIVARVIDTYFNNLNAIASKLWIHRLFPEIAQSKVYQLGNVYILAHVRSAVPRDFANEEKLLNIRAVLYGALMLVSSPYRDQKRTAKNPVIHPAKSLPIDYIFDYSSNIPDSYAKLMFVSSKRSLGLEDRIFSGGAIPNDIADLVCKYFLLSKTKISTLKSKVIEMEKSNSNQNDVIEPVIQNFQKSLYVCSRNILHRNQDDANQIIDFNLDKKVKMNELLAKDQKVSNFDDYLDSAKLKPVIDDKFITALTNFAKSLSANNAQSAPSKEPVDYFSKTIVGLSSVLKDIKDSIERFANEKLTSQTSSSVKENDLNAIAKFTKETYDKLGLQVAKLEKELVNLTHKNLPISFEMKTLMHAKKDRTFDSLYACFYASSVSCYKRKFPYLDNGTLDSIHIISHQYYTIQVFMQYLKKLETLAQAKNSQTLLDELQKAGDFNNRFTLPGVLNFEFRSGAYNLKPEQTVDLQTLTEEKEKGNFFSVVLQRMMAAGKTLVLGTLATIIKARKEETLSMLIPPSSLFASNAASMQARTYKYFKSRGRVLHFKRLPVVDSIETALRVNLHLRWMSETINLALKNRDYILISPDSLQSFQNAFIEYLDGLDAVIKSPHENLFDLYQIALFKLADIYSIFLNKGAGILDEIDMTMNPKKELNYPTREREGYNEIAAFLTADLVEFTALDADIASKCRLDLRKNNQSGLTEKGFACVKEAWLQYIKKQLKDSKSDWFTRFENISKKIKVLKFLQSDNPSSFYENLLALHKDNEVEVNALIIMKKQIDVFLRESLKGAVNEHYGPAGSNRPEVKVAVPYLAANTPSISSVFADRWETLNKSLFMTVVNPIGSKKESQEIILWLKKQIEKEAQTYGSSASSATLANFLKLHKMAHELDIAQCNHEDDQIVSIVKDLLSLSNRASIRLRFTHLFDTVISILDFPVEQITSNALNMASMTKSIQGYSGTIDNVNCLPHVTVKDALKDHEANEIYNGGIVRKLLIENPKTEKVPEVSSLSAVSVEDLTCQILSSLLADENLYALIDVGAFLKNFKNRQVAKVILKLLDKRIKCVLYYDEDSNLVEFMTIDGSIGRLTETDPDSITKATGHGKAARFTFYDQRHITGSDIAQVPLAKAVLTVGPKVLLRDILQGTLRMRQFMTTQKVSFSIIPETRKIWADLAKESSVPESLTAANLIELGALNESEKQVQENIRLAYVKINNEVRTKVLKNIIEALKNKSNINFTAISDKFRLYRSLFVRNIQENPLGWMAQVDKVSAKVALERYTDLVAADKTLADEVKKKLLYSKDAESILYFLKDTKLPLVAQESALGSEVEQEVNVAMLVDVDMDLEVEDSTEDLQFYVSFPIRFSNLQLDNNLVNNGFAGGSSRRLWTSLPQIMQNADGTSIRFLENFVKTSDDPKLELAVEEILTNFVYSQTRTVDYQLFSNFNWEGTHFIYVKYPVDRSKIILIGTPAAEFLIQEMQKFGSSFDQVDVKVTITDLSGNVSATNDAAFKPGADQIPVNLFTLNDKHEDIKNGFVKLLIFNGSLNQLLFDEKLSAVFREKYLRDIIGPGLLGLMLQRMKALKGKMLFTFTEDFPVYTKVLYAANGNASCLHYLVEGKQFSHDSVDETKTKTVVSSANNSMQKERAVGNYSKLPVKLTEKEESELGSESLFAGYNKKKIDMFAGSKVRDPIGWKVYAAITLTILVILSIGGFVFYRIKKQRAVAEAENSTESDLPPISFDDEAAEIDQEPEELELLDSIDFDDEPFTKQNDESHEE